MNESWVIPEACLKEALESVLQCYEMGSCMVCDKAYKEAEKRKKELDKVE